MTKFLLIISLLVTSVPVWGQNDSRECRLVDWNDNIFHISYMPSKSHCLEKLCKQYGYKIAEKGTTVSCEYDGDEIKTFRKIRFKAKKKFKTRRDPRKVYKTRRGKDSKFHKRRARLR